MNPWVQSLLRVSYPIVLYDITSVNFDVCQCKVGLFPNVQSLITLSHGSLCMPNCLICMFIVVTSCLYKRVCQ